MPEHFYCPRALIGITNGVYYYTVLDCPEAVLTTATDNEEHRTGGNCENCTDPIFEDRSINDGYDPPTAMPPCPGCDIENRLLVPRKGHSKYIEPHGRFLATGEGVTVIEEYLVKYNDLSSVLHKAKLFVLTIPLPPAIGGFAIMRVGQEIDPSVDVPNLLEADIDNELDDYFHRVKLSHGRKSLFYVWLAEEP